MGFLLYLKKDVEYNSWKLEAGSSKEERSESRNVERSKCGEVSEVEAGRKK